MAVSVAAFADEITDEYKKIMQPAAAANMALQRVMETDLAAAATNAGELQAAFAKIEEFWTKRGTADAMQFAKNVQAVAKEVHAAAGNREATAAAARRIGANCQGCHMAHRERLPDGSFLLK
jgi:muramidase (phage lysozyme)